MAKEAFYFSHDSNASHDPKMIAMRGVYGSEGYGWFWLLIEMMREADGHKLDMQGKYTFNAYALHLLTDCKTVEQFVQDCVNEFNLFRTDGSHFWSESLLRRMEKKEQITEKRRAAAEAKWEKVRAKSSFSTSDDANASKTDANATEMDALKEIKVNEIKVNKIINNTPTTSGDVAMNPYRFYEEERFGRLSSSINHKITIMIDLYTERFVLKAMEEAVYYDKRFLPYVNDILERWSKTGHDEPWTLPKETNRKQSGSASRAYNKVRQLPVIPINQTDDAPRPLSPEEREEMQRMIAKMGGNFKLEAN